MELVGYLKIGDFSSLLVIVPWDRVAYALSPAIQELESPVGTLLGTHRTRCIGRLAALL